VVVSRHHSTDMYCVVPPVKFESGSSISVLWKSNSLSKNWVQSQKRSNFPKRTGFQNVKKASYHTIVYRILKCFRW
jgi:hypothetical protein